MSSAKRKFSVYLLAGAVLATGILAAESATANHIRAKSATPFSSSLVVAYNECTAPNSTHNPAFLAGGSCIGVAGGALGGKTSSFITSGDPLSTQAPSGTGAPAQFQGALVQVFSAAAPAPNCGGGGGCKTIMFKPSGPNLTNTAPAAPNSSYLADVRCGPAFPAAHPACSAVGAANPSGNADYTGFLSAQSSLRISDHNNETAPGSATYTAAGTVTQLLFTVPVACSVSPAASSPAAGIGAYCTAAATDAHALCGCIRQTAGGLANIEEGQVEVVDGNIDANPFATADGPNSAAYRQGVFIP
jgi:hypothetical protein